jgi:hypothetical protein
LNGDGNPNSNDIDVNPEEAGTVASILNGDGNPNADDIDDNPEVVDIVA